jgi:nucleotide-binding universal stress UspA family protein
MIGPSGVSYAETESQASRLEMIRLNPSEAFKNVSCTQTLEQGELLEVVQKMVTDLSIDLIILGTHGRRGLKYIVRGSVAEQVFRHVTCPVLTVCPRVQNKSLAQGRINRILYATDLSSASLRALEYGLYIARTSHAELMLLHAILHLAEYPNVDSDEGVRETRRRLTELMDKSDVEYQVIVGNGPIADVIVGVAEESKADLAIMGAHRGSWASAHIPWAIAHQVACRTPCPLLMVPN